MNRSTNEGMVYLERVFDVIDDTLSDEIGLDYGQDVLASASCYYASGLQKLGRFEQARERMQIALARAAKVGDPHTSGFVNAKVGWLCAEIGDEPGLADCIATLEGTLLERPMALWSGNLANLKGVHAFMQGRQAEAIELIEEGLRLTDQFGFFAWRAVFVSKLARAQLAVGQHEQALKSVQDALSNIEADGLQLMEAELHRIQGSILEAKGESIERVEHCYRCALKHANEHPHRLFELRAARNLATLLRDDGRLQEATTLLSGACTSIEEPAVLQDHCLAVAFLDELNRGTSRI